MWIIGLVRQSWLEATIHSHRVSGLPLDYIVFIPEIAVYENINDNNNSFKNLAQATNFLGRVG